MTCFRSVLIGLGAVLLVSCGGATEAASSGDASSDAGDAAVDVTVPADVSASPDVTAPPDAAVPSKSCQTLVLTFVGCDEERLKECEREYDAVSAANRALVDASAACLGANFPTVQSATWPPAGATCTPTAVPPLLSASDQWFHGTCQSDNGDVAVTLPTDPGFPACGGDAGQPQCFFGDTPATL